MVLYRGQLLNAFILFRDITQYLLLSETALILWTDPSSDFVRVSEKIMQTSEQPGRQAQPETEPSTVEFLG